MIQGIIGGMIGVQFLIQKSWLIFAVIMLASCLLLVIPIPAHALSIDDYFTYSYSIQLSHTEVFQGEEFSATVSGQAVCKTDLPFGMTPNAASVTSRITARHNVTGDIVELNSGYTVSIDSFPSTPGDSVQDTVIVPLIFPYDSEPGNYTITGEIVTAKVRVAFIWLDVTQYLPSFQDMGNVTCFTTDISETSVFLMKYTVKSTDGMAAVTFQSGTTGTTQVGESVLDITVTERKNPPPPPVNCEAIGLTYDFGPNGTSFDQPITIRLNYDQDQLPENVVEKNLVIAVWDDQLEEWDSLDSTIDTHSNFITAEVTSFSLYTIIAYTRPATLTINDLSISPTLVNTGENIIVSTVVKNTGDLTGIYQLELKVDREVYYVRSIRLDGGDSITESFLIYLDTPGIHTVDIAGLSGTFVIEEGKPSPTLDTDDIKPIVPVTITKAVTPVEIAGGDSIVIRVIVTNMSSNQESCRVSLMKDKFRVDTKEVPVDGDASQQVIFTTLQDDAVTYTVEITGPAGIFSIEDMPPSIPETPESKSRVTLKWWLMGSIGTFCVIVVLIAFLVIMRSRI